jgi:PilX N-terminal
MRKNSKTILTGYRRANERGAVLIVGMIVLLLITIIVVGTFNLTQSNQKVVYNQQVRDEAVAAAQAALERIVSTNFTQNIVAQTAQTVSVDINNDDLADYTVTVDKPVCIRVIKAAEGQPSDVELGADMQTAGYWYTDWEFRSTVLDAITGAQAKVVQGIRLYQTDSEKNTSCS